MNEFKYINWHQPTPEKSLLKTAYHHGKSCIAEEHFHAAIKLIAIS